MSEKYCDIIEELVPNIKFIGLDEINQYISGFAIRKNLSETTISLLLVRIDYNSLENFLIKNGIVISEKLKELLHNLCYCKQLGIDIRNFKDTISFYFKEKKSPARFSRSYKNKLPKDITEDTLKITYDLKNDKIHYIKTYSKLTKKSIGDKGVFENFGFYLNDDGSTLPVVKQKCYHVKVRNERDVQEIFKEEYNKISKFDYKLTFAYRESSDQAYLYVKKSL